MTRAADRTVEDNEVSALRCLSFFEVTPPGILKRINLRGSGDRVPGISSEIAGRNYVVRSAPSNTSDYFPAIVTTQACLRTILQTADTPVPSHAQA